jgi:hypothetical protein
MAKATINGTATSPSTLATNTPTTNQTYVAPVTGNRHDDGHT